VDSTGRCNTIKTVQQQFHLLIVGGMTRLLGVDQSLADAPIQVYLPGAETVADACSWWR